MVIRLLLALSLVGTSALANELRVEPLTVQLGEAVEVTVRLQDSFAARSGIRLPISNLVIEQGPSISSDFQWINGRTSRTKTFRYVARPRREGTAVVGPIELLARSGRRLRLDAVTIKVIGESEPPPSDPAAALEQSRARAGLFVTVNADKSEAFLGEQVVLTWTLYSRDPLRGYRLTSVPVLDGFWSEEIPQPRQDSEQVIIGGEVLQRATVRRVALFPLRTGTQRVAPLEVMAEVVEADDFFDRWGFLERRVEDHRVRSGPLELLVKSIPTEVSAVGEFSMQCTAAVVPRKGPVTLDVMVDGTGNLRAVEAPSFGAAVDGSVEIQARETTVNRQTQPIRMTRGWRYLIFPRRAGGLRVPELTFEYFDPATAQAHGIRCGEQQLAVTAENLVSVDTQVAETTRPDRSTKRRALNVPFTVGIAALVLSGAVWAGAARRRAGSPLFEEIWNHRASPREMRQILHDGVNAAGLRVTELFQDESALAEAFRSLHSLIDVMEKEPWEIETSEKELRRRARDFDRELRRLSRA